jgi:membrane protein
MEGMIEGGKRLATDIDQWSRGHRSARIARRAITGFLAHDALQFAGSMAYFGVLSVFQLLVLGVVVASLILGEGTARDVVLDQVEAGSPLDRETVGGVIDAIVDSRGSITIISFAFLLWSALGIFSALSSGIGRAFEATAPRPFLADKLLGLLLMAITGVLAIASFVIGLVTGVLQQLAAEVVGGLPGGGTAVWLIGLIAPIVLIFIAFWVIYRVVPNRPVSFADVWPGALVATLLWTVLRFGFTWYATSIANYDSAFGPISTGVTLLVFLYFASLIVLLGAEVARAAVLDRQAVVATAEEPDQAPATRVAPPGFRPRRAGAPRWLLVAAGAAVGVIAGRLSKRDTE